MQIFKKREKLVYSPEAGNKGTQEENDHYEEKPIVRTDAFKIKLDSLLEQTQNQVYQFDKVINHTKTSRDIFKDLLETDMNEVIMKNKRLLLINILKSDTILNYSSEAYSFREELSNLHDDSNIDNLGVLPVILSKFLNFIQKQDSLDRDIFENQPESNQLKFSAFTVLSNRIIDLAIDESKVCETEKEISKQKISNFDGMLGILGNIRSNVLSKKIAPNWLCYRMSVKFWDGKAMRTGKVFMIDFINPFDKVPERMDKDSKKVECNPEFLCGPMRILLSTFAGDHCDQVYLLRFYHNTE